MAAIKRILNKRNQSYNLSFVNAAKNGDLKGVVSALENGADVNFQGKDQQTALHQASNKGHTDIVKLLLKYQPDPNICDEDQQTPLHQASSKGHTYIVQLLLEYNADPNICDEYQWTPLHCASNNGHTEIVQLLLQHQADPNICNKDQWTALHCASNNGHTEIVQLLLQHQADPNICNKYQWTVLFWASRNGHTEIVQLLLKYNADPNICDMNQRTALHWASENGYTEIVQLLLQYKADLNICNKDQETALHWASSSGHTEIVQLFLQYKADPNICDKYKRTALYWASYNGHAEVVQLLLEHQANPNIYNKDQWTALHWASYNGHTEIVQLLLQHQANPNIYNKDQWTALHWASRNSHTEIVQLLLKYNADLNICDKNQRTALHWASENGYTEIVQLLLEHQAVPNICDKDQQTPLYWASRKGYIEIVQLLLQHQADPNICDMYGNTALHIACSEGNVNVISSLLSEGADVTVKNNNGNTPLEKCQDTIRNEIVSLFNKYNPKQVLEDVSKWNIENVEEDQVFEKKNYGVMLVIPPSAVEKKKEVKTEVKVVAPEETNIILPPDVELVSCFYKIETTGKFSKPIELYLQHNVELTSQEECEQLAFIKAKGPPPYKFELVPIEIDQKFKPNDNSGVIRVSDFSVFSIVKIKQKLKSLFFRSPSSSYVMTLFFKHLSRSSWAIQAVVTKNLGPFLKRVNTDKCFESWNKIETFSFHFGPEVNEVTSLLVNDYYDIKPLKIPCQVTKEAVDKSQPDTALPYLKFKASLKANQELTDLELTFKGMKDGESLVIAREELQQIQSKTEDVPTAQSVSKHSEPLSQQEIYNDLLCEGPKPPATLSTSQCSTTSTLPHPTSTTFPISPTSTASTPSSIDNQSSIRTPPIVSDPSSYSTKSSCQSNIPNDLLCKVPKKHHLMMLLHPIKYMWNTFGEQLEVPYDDIKSAEYNEAYGDTTKFSEVLQVWMNKKTCVVCWQTIISVVEEPPVENKVVADYIYQFLTRPDIQNEYLSSHHHTDQLIPTFNSPPQIGRSMSTAIHPPIAPKPTTRKGRPLSYPPPPIAPKPTKKKVEIDEMEQEAPLQSSNPIGFAAHCLHKQAKQWEEKDNDMIVATKRMARLMMKMSNFAKDEKGDVTSKEDFIQTTKLIVKDSKEVVDIATKVVEVCTDTQLKNTLSQVIDGIPTYATQLKINVDVHGKRGGDNPEGDREATRLLTVNAENLMTAVSVVLNTTESALIKVPPETRAHLTGLSWIKKS